MKMHWPLFLSITLFLATSGTAQDEPREIPPAAPVTNAVQNAGERNLRLNFRGVPLDMVLNYLSEAAGFVIVLETEPKGKVDVWSNQPLSKEEAVDLLNTILNKNGYAAIRNGRTLRILSRDDAKTKDIPVHSGSKAEEIPKSDQMVTQVIPVKYANATQLTKDLQPLLPTYATLTANESGNALVLTDVQSNIRRMVEIVEALDTSIQNVSSIRVFPLRYADAKELANAVKELFTPPTAQNQSANQRNQFFNRFGGGPGAGPGGGPGGGGRGGNASTGTGGAPNARVLAIADERTNSLLVSAPEEALPTIEKLVREVDVNIADITELRVFHLVNADPLEMADIFAELFPDETRTNSGNNNQGNRFPFQFGGNRRNSQATEQSQRALMKDKVVAVPDQRTSSLIVSASREMMPEIEGMIRQLDASPARKQRVYIYNLENADVQQVEEVVRNMFERTTTQANRNTQNQASQLETRTRQLQNQSGGSAASRNTGFGQGQGQGTGTFR